MPDYAAPLHAWDTEIEVLIQVLQMPPRGWRPAVRALLALPVFVGLAFSGTIGTLTPTGVDWTRGESLWIDEDGVSTDAYFTGVIFIALSEGGQNYTRDTLCVDLFTDIYLGITYDTTLLHPYQYPAKNLDRISWLVDNALLPTEGTYNSVLPQSDWVRTVQQGAGIQLAIWDITHDNGDGFSAGRVQASTTPGKETDPVALAWATAYETLSDGQTSGLAFVYYNTNIATGAPAQMLEGPEFTDGGPTPNPEPPTCLLAGGVLVALSLWARRRIDSRV